MRVEYNRSLGDVFETWVATDENPADAVRALREMLPAVFTYNGPADKAAVAEPEKEPDPVISSSKRKPDGEERVGEIG